MDTIAVVPDASLQRHIRYTRKTAIIEIWRLLPDNITKQMNSSAANPSTLFVLSKAAELIHSVFSFEKVLQR